MTIARMNSGAGVLACAEVKRMAASSEISLVGGTERALVVVRA